MQAMCFIAIAKPIEALAFGWDRLLADEPFALIFNMGGIGLWIQKVKALMPQSFTMLGRAVEDIAV